MLYACVDIVTIVQFSDNMAMSWIGFTCFLCVLFARSALCLYFHMGETEKKCFIEEIPDETMVTGACVDLFFNDYLNIIWSPNEYRAKKFNVNNLLIVNRSYQVKIFYFYLSTSLQYETIVKFSKLLFIF